MSSELGASNGDDPQHDEDDLPFDRAHTDPEEIPGLLERALEHLSVVTDEEEFTLGDAEFERATGVWITGIGVYIPEEDTPSTQEEIAAGASPTGPWGNRMLEWERDAQRAMRKAWGEPALHTPRLAGEAQEPEGLIDYMMLNQGFAEADLWDRGDYFVAMLTDWSGQPGASMLRQVVLLLPRYLMMRGMGALIDDKVEVLELLMHGEDPLELRRRAWLMSTIYDHGDVRLRSAPIEASRCSLQARSGVTSVWIFADDGRQLLLIQDPESGFTELLERTPDDERLTLIDRLLRGVPEDLLACIAAPGETPSGDIAELSLEFGLLDGRPVPIVSGAFWFDGLSWRVTPGQAEIGYFNRLVADDHGFQSAVRRPFRLGGEFTVDLFSPQTDTERRGTIERCFEACPFPAQPRPEGDAVLSYGIPRTETTFADMVEEIEAASEAWWDREPGDRDHGDPVFAIAGRELDGSSGVGTIDCILAASEQWHFDALQQWAAGLRRAMTERWGEPFRMDVLNGPDGAGRRTPLTRLMRGSGFEEAPLWWVKGNAVVLLSGVSDPSMHDDPLVVLGIARADSVVEMLGRMSIWEARRRARLVENLAVLTSSENGEAGLEEFTPSIVSWQGPPLPGSEIVPPVRRIDLRADGYHWVWHLGHDGRALLTVHSTTAVPGMLPEQAELFADAPRDLLPLAECLPPAVAAFFHDGMGWRAPRALLRRSYERSEAEGISPLDALHSDENGVPALTKVMLSGGAMSMDRLTHLLYGEYAFGRPITAEEVNTAYDRLGDALPLALTGDLNRLLDIVLDGPGNRSMVDAALSNPDPQHRREISLWLLREGSDVHRQLSFMTPVNVLFANPTLAGEDACVLQRLIDSGADPGFGLLGPTAGMHPLIQLCDRDADEGEFAPLVDLLIETLDAADCAAVLNRLGMGEWPRDRLLARLEALTDV